MKTKIDARVLNRLLGPVVRCFTPETARALVGLRVDAVAQARIDVLAEKCSEGILSVEEHAEYSSYIAAIDLISILQSQARAFLAGKPDAA